MSISTGCSCLILIVLLASCAIERSCIAACEQCAKVTLECYTKGSIDRRDRQE